MIRTYPVIYGGPTAGGKEYVPLKWAKTAIEQAQQWQLAIDQLLSGWHSTADSYSTPHEAVKALIAFEVMAALDPRVSSDAEALVEQGRREERARCLYFIRNHPGNGKKQVLLDRIMSGQPAAAIRARGEAQ